MKKAKAWPGARLLSSAFCNALPFYLTACIMPRPLPPLTPYSPAPRNQVYGCGASRRLAAPCQKSWKTSGEDAATRELLSRLLLKTACRKKRNSPQVPQSRCKLGSNFHSQKITLISSGSTQAHVLTVRHGDHLYSSSDFNQIFTCDTYTRILEVSLVTQIDPYKQRNGLDIGTALGLGSGPRVNTGRCGPCHTELAVRVKKGLKTSRSKTRGAEEAKNSCGNSVLHLLCK